MRKLLLLLTIWGITNTLSAQEKTFAPFVKGGVLISNGTTNDSQEALWGYNLGVGAYIHLFKNSSLYAVPSLELKRKGARLSAQYDAEITTKCLYLQLTADLARRFHPNRNQAISFGLGPYVAYGVSGKTYGSPGVYLYNGVPVDRHYDTFGTEIGFERWDAGIHTFMEYELKKFFIGTSFEVGAVSVDRRRLSVNRNGLSIMDFNLYLGYRF